MARQRLILLAALLAPLAAAHPVALGNDVEIDVHMLDATDGTRRHWAEHFRYPPEPGADLPLLTNRSYFVEVAMTKAGAPVDGMVRFVHNGTIRWMPTEGGVVRLPLGHPALGLNTVFLYAQPHGWLNSVAERFDWLAVAGTGPLEPEPLERWGYRSLSEWRTYEWTAQRDGFAKVTLGWDGVEGGPGGFLALIFFRLPDGTNETFYAWTAYDGMHPARVVVASGDTQVAFAPESPVSFTSGRDFRIGQGDLPAGSVVQVTQGVLRPNDRSRFFVAAEAEPGMLAFAETARGPMEVRGWPDFRGGFQATATVLGTGESSRSGRVAEFDLARNGTVFLEAYVGQSQGTYAWRFAGEEVTTRFAQGARFWTFGGECAGRWWLRADAGAFADESYALLSLGDYRFPDPVRAKLTKPTGSSACLRAP